VIGINSALLLIRYAHYWEAGNIVVLLLFILHGLGHIFRQEVCKMKIQKQAGSFYETTEGY